MSAEFANWWPAPLLPRRDGGAASLFFVIAVLSFLASLSAIGGLAAQRAADGWKDQLIGSATVIVRASASDTPDAAAARAAEVLAGVRGVSEARALDKARADALIARFVGPEPLPADVPIPRLVAIDLDAAAPAKPAALAAALKAAGVDGTVEDHGPWAAQIMRGAALARWLAIGLLTVIAAAAGAVIAFAARQGLSARRDLVEVLHLAGATDGFIARLFQLRFARTAAQAGIVGAAAAIGVAAALRQFGAGQSLAALLPVAWTDLAAPLPWPLIAALIAAIAARVTVDAVLKRSP
ncbi:MAG TPA: ABC transporter permease [Caulobacteraceae bacterium]